MAHSSVIIIIVCTSRGDAMELTIVEIFPTKGAVPVSFMMWCKLRRYLKHSNLFF